MHGLVLPKVPMHVLLRVGQKSKVYMLFTFCYNNKRLQTPNCLQRNHIVNSSVNKIKHLRAFTNDPLTKTKQKVFSCILSIP